MIISNRCLPADGNREIKQSEHFRAHVLDEQVTDDGGRQCRVAGLSNADHRAA